MSTFTKFLILAAALIVGIVGGTHFGAYLRNLKDAKQKQ